MTNPLIERNMGHCMRKMCILLSWNCNNAQPFEWKISYQTISDQLLKIVFTSCQSKKNNRFFHSQSRRGSRNQILFSICFVHFMWSVFVWIHFCRIFGEEYRQFSKTVTKIKQTKIIIKPMKTNTEYIFVKIVSLFSCIKPQREREDKQSMNWNSLSLETQSSKPNHTNVENKREKDMLHLVCFFYLITEYQQTNK